jgi:hypothetical protein
MSENVERISFRGFHNRRVFNIELKAVVYADRSTYI